MSRPGPMPAAAWWLAAVVAVSMVLALVLSADPDKLAGIRSAGPDSYSYSLLGHRALAEFLERSGFDVARVRTRYVPDVDRSTAVLLYEPLPPGAGPAPPDSTWEEPIAAVASREGSLVVALPKWRGTEDERRSDWLHTLELRRLPDVARAVDRYHLPRTTLVRGPEARLRCATAWGESVTVTAPRLQWLKAGPEARPLVWRDSLVLIARFDVPMQDTIPNPRRPAVVRQHYDARVYVVTDPDLLNNRGLARGDHARMLRRFLESEVGAHRVAFDERIHHGLVSRSLAAELLRYPLVLLMAQAILLLLFLVWSLGVRFGAPRPLAPPAVSRMALAATAAELLAGAGSAPITLQIYWEQVLREVSARVAGPAVRTRRQLIETLSEVGRARGARHEVRELDDEVERLQRDVPRPERAVVHAARRIHEWYREMIHGR